MAAVGSITVTRSSQLRRGQRIALAWTCSAGGAVSGIPEDGFNGQITRVTTVPGSGGNAPTDNYDVTLLDSENVDVLAGLGIDRDTANTESIAPMLGSGANVPVIVVGSLTLNIANAGNAKSGTVVIYLDAGGRL